MQRNGEALQRIEGMERDLGEPDIQRLSRGRSEAATLRGRLEGARRRGEAREELRRLIAEVSPEVARQIMIDEMGRPMSRRQERRAERRMMARLRRQANLQRVIVGSSGARVAPVFRGTAAVMLAIEVFNIFSPFIQQEIEERRERTRRDVYLFLNVALWWTEKGIDVPVQGVAGGNQLTTPEALINSLRRRMFDDLSEDQRREVERSLNDSDRRNLQSASPLDYLFIPQPSLWTAQEPVWDLFLQWTSAHVNNFDDYAAEFLDADNPAIRRKDGGFGETDWEIHVAQLGTDGHIEDRWVVSPDLTNIMNATARRVIAGTNTDIARTWGRREQVGRRAPQGPTIGPAGPSSVSSTGRPTRRARFSGGDRSVYFRYEDGPQEVSRFQFWSNNPVFLIYENDDAPQGYVWVSGADYNTYGALRSAEVWHLERVVDIPRMPRTLDVNSPDFMQDIPEERYMSREERAAWQLVRQQPRPQGVFYTPYSQGANSRYRGQLRLWLRGPNVSARLLVRRGDLTFEE
jgi:hypothetical protein